MTSIYPIFFSIDPSHFKPLKSHHRHLYHLLHLLVHLRLTPQLASLLPISSLNPNLLNNGHPCTILNLETLVHINLCHISYYILATLFRSLLKFEGKDIHIGKTTLWVSFCMIHYHILLLSTICIEYGSQ